MIINNSYCVASDSSATSTHIGVHYYWVPQIYGQLVLKVLLDVAVGWTHQETFW
jgi:hypothetical protein